MADKVRQPLIELDVDEAIWDHFYGVFPLVVIGTRDADGADDLAPKHLAIPMSWSNHFGFVCTPRHSTYHNIQVRQQFTVTYVRPSQAVLASLAATPRCDDGSKPIVQALPTMPAEQVHASFIENGYLFLECVLHQIVDDLGVNSLIIGKIVAARIHEEALRTSDGDDQQLLANAPLLAYLYPDRFSEISEANVMPFPTGYQR